MACDKLSANDQNFVLRMRLLNQAHRDQLARLREGCVLCSVVDELRDAYRRAHEARPIYTGRGVGDE